MTTSTNTLNNAIQLHQSGKITEAISHYLQIIEDGQHDQVLELIGIAYGQINDIDQSVRYFKQAAKHQPHKPSIQNNLANCYRKQGKSKAAKKIYLAILKNNHKQCATMNNLGILYYEQQAYDRAIILFMKAICIQPDYPDPYYNIGLIYQRSNDPKFIHYMQKASLLKHPHAHYQLALYYESNNDIPSAILAYQNQLNMIPNHGLSHHGIGRCYLQDNNDQEGLYHLIEAQKINPHLPNLMENIASFYHVKGQYANAIEYWSKAPRNEENRTDIMYNIGVAYHYSGRHQDALNYFYELIKKFPKHTNSHINIAAIALQNGQNKIAIEHYKVAQQQQPDNEELQFILSALTQDQIKHKTAPKEYIEKLFDQYSGHYDQHLMNILQYQLPEQIELHLHEALTPNQSLSTLDLGCGTGLMGHILKPFSNKITGVDLSPNMLSKAADKNIYDELVQMECHEYLESSPMFDCILATELMPYIGDLQKIITLMVQKTKPGGLIIFSYEYGECQSHQLTKNARYIHNPEYVRSLTQAHETTEQSLTIRRQNSAAVLGRIVIIRI